MFNLRQVVNDELPANQDAIRQVQQIIRQQFPLVKETDIRQIPDELNNPLKYKFKTILLVAENLQGTVKGFALFKNAPDIGFVFLDFIATGQGRTGAGIGGALYERVREECLHLGTDGLFMECLPDDPALCRDPAVLRQNASRLRFYEKYGARPLANTKYETPLSPDDDCPPYLVFDDLGSGKVLGLEKTKLIVRAILERKYGKVCPAGYIDMVVDSFRDDPVMLRPLRYVRETQAVSSNAVPQHKRIALVFNAQHDIHHIRQTGYVEAPVRVTAILKEIRKSALFADVAYRRYSEKAIHAVHAPMFTNYLKRVCLSLPESKSIYPYVFPVRNPNRPPQELSVRAGYYCMDTFTPLNRNAFLAARAAVDCGLTAADQLLRGTALAYALVRPPGHHAEKNLFGGFCYFNTTAIAAHYLSRYGKIAILDIDYHHGNGQQDIFYDRADVLTISLHGHPNIAYPYFSGFKDERGYAEGLGYNFNYPLPESLKPETFRSALEHALKKIMRFKPTFLMVAFGADTAKGDPTGSWAFTGNDFFMHGRMIGALRYPTLVIQEGGYRIRTLGMNVARFFEGLWNGFYKAA